MARQVYHASPRSLVVERGAYDAVAVGSIPTGGIRFCHMAVCSQFWKSPTISNIPIEVYIRQATAITLNSCSCSLTGKARGAYRPWLGVRIPPRAIFFCIIQPTQQLWDKRWFSWFTKIALCNTIPQLQNTRASNPRENVYKCLAPHFRLLFCALVSVLRQRVVGIIT